MGEKRGHHAFNKSLSLNVTGRDPVFLTKWIGKALNNSASIYSLGEFVVFELWTLMLLELLSVIQDTLLKQEARDYIVFIASCIPHNYMVYFCYPSVRGTVYSRTAVQAPH